MHDIAIENFKDVLKCNNGSEIPPANFRKETVRKLNAFCVVGEHGLGLSLVRGLHFVNCVMNFETSI